MFQIKCIKCGWSLKTKGTKKELSELNLKEVKNTCSTCGKPRKFVCKKCSSLAKMLRIPE
jgi:hypothetical protein